MVSTQTKGSTNRDTAPLHRACHALSCSIIMRLTNGPLSTFLKDVLAMKLFEAQAPRINVWSHWIHFLHVFTLSQTGLENAVGEGCLVINSRVCTGRILLFLSLCSGDRYGNWGPRPACAHREKGSERWWISPVVFAHLQLLCLYHTAAALFESESATGILVI